jgi:hypothetical protein
MAQRPAEAPREATMEWRTAATSELGDGRGRCDIGVVGEAARVSHEERSGS